MKLNINFVQKNKKYKETNKYSHTQVHPDIVVSTRALFLIEKKSCLLEDEKNGLKLKSIISDGKQ